MRGISERFVQDLKSGCLSFFLKQVKENREKLCLEIRENYINIYYRGGNLLKIKQMKYGYRFYFDANYCLHKKQQTNYELLKSLNPESVGEYVDNFKSMMAEMDIWLDDHPKPEREFQHKLLVNNPKIVDIEYAPPKSKVTGVKLPMRMDMMMVDGDKLIIVENKFGTGAIAGDAGIKKHYEDICKLFNNVDIYDEMIQSVLRISQTKYDLGLLDYSVDNIDKTQTEILLLFADFNERCEVLKNELELIDNRHPIGILKMSSNDSVIDLSKIEKYN